RRPPFFVGPAWDDGRLAMRMRGLEPPPGCPDTDLNRARLPIPPHPRGGRRYRRSGALLPATRAAPRYGDQPDPRGTSGLVPGALLACSLSLRAAIVQGTRTPPSHGGNPGSNPGSGTQKALASAGVFVVRGAVCASSRATRPETRAFHPASASTFDPCRLGLNMARTGAAFDLARHWQEQGNASAGPTPPAPWL